MKDLKEMTPIELNVLINKTNENHEITKIKIYELLDEVSKLKEEINSKLEIITNLEDKYVKLMEILIEKQK